MSSSISLDNYMPIYEQLQKTYNEAQNIFNTTQKTDNERYNLCISLSSDLIRFFNELNPLIVSRHKEPIKHTYHINSELLIRSVGINTQRSELSNEHKNMLHIAITHLRVVLNIEPFFKPAMELYKISYIYLTIFNPNVEENLALLKQVLSIDPCDYQLQYNLGFSYQRANKLDEALQHFKMSLTIIDLMLNSKDKLTNDQMNGLNDFKVKNYNGLGSLYFSIQDRELASYYFELALKISPDDPDINNQLGVVYTELRYTEKAIKYYEHGIKNYKKAQISNDKEMLIASMYMNMGLARCYECDFVGAIDSYNKALKYKPRLSLAYQNKLLDLNYISHEIEDPMYIAKLHKNINKIYTKVISDYKESIPSYVPKHEFLTCKDKKNLNGKKLNIGFVSGDFICHPVSFFIHSILGAINYDIFEVHCFSVKVVKLESMFPKCNWYSVKNKSAEDFAELIKSKNIDILFDLSAHTGDNRLDTFILKPAPIQISYCGYPGTSGIKSMDYHITDKYADCKESEKYYTEKLLYMSKSFLAYTPSMTINNLPPIAGIQPCTKNNYITFGTFNRFNKINKKLISVWEKILIAIPNARIMFKTKEFLTPKIKTYFFDCFKNKSVLDRVIILDYADTYTEHLDDYNKMDIALDSFPYSGTTTSCEALMMGCPVLTLYDNIRYYHTQNVTTSFMKNIGMSEYVAYSEQAYVDKAVNFSKNLDKLHNLKLTVRNNFVFSPICDYKGFTNEFEDLLINTYKNHKW
jgi:predicted O-linked N-acetylglucosamine transferase (SPINDLY family)